MALIIKVVARTQAQVPLQNVMRAQVMVGKTLDKFELSEKKLVDHLNLARRNKSAESVAEVRQALDSFINQDPESSIGLAARFMRARAFEDGTFGEVQTDAALDDFIYLSERSAKFGSEGIIGYARVLLRKDSNRSNDVISLCREAVALDNNRRAMMIMGFVYENIMGNFSKAKYWYLRAWRNGMPWGMRFYAEIKLKERSLTLGVLAHCLATVTSPFMVLWRGCRFPFK